MSAFNAVTPARAANAFTYWAFVSYSHRDRRWAEWLHSALESYKIPKALIGRATSDGVIPARLAPVFRDRDELPASADLGATIREALAQARSLIVLCSPAAAASRWTNEEIASFRRVRPDGRILAVIVAGEPFASEIPGREDEECFPPALRYRLDASGAPTKRRAEPIAADLRDHGDGKRMALLKVVAGMLGVGLDELARREEQRRQKRLSYIAAASLAGMIATTGLAVTAIQARDEARDQRREAEGLVGFMLGDLRAKLEPLGRLDVLDSVGAKALQYYQAQDKGGLTEEGLAQRAKALTLIGEIANLRGDLDGALLRFREARASTAEAVARAPDDDQRIFDHAQNVFWVGYIAWQQGQLDEAEAAFRDYKRLATRLIALNPNKPEWQLEGVYADSNLGTLQINRMQFGPAVGTFSNALAAAEKLAASAPSDLAYLTQVAEALASLSEAQESHGRLEEAMHSRERQMDVLKRLTAANANDVVVLRKTVAARRAMGRLLASRGDTGGGLEQLRSATDLAGQLRRREPGNTEWLAVAAGTHGDFGDLLLVSGDVGAAERSIRAGCEIAERLVDRDNRVVMWRIELHQRCLLPRARAAAARGHHDEALAHAGRAIALWRRETPEVRQANAHSGAPAYLILGDQYAALGDDGSAGKAWQAGLGDLAGPGAEQPGRLALRHALLQRLGRDADATKVAGRLAAIGYRHPAYVAARQ